MNEGGREGKEGGGRRETKEGGKGGRETMEGDGGRRKERGGRGRGREEKRETVSKGLNKLWKVVRLLLLFFCVVAFSREAVISCSDCEV